MSIEPAPVKGKTHLHTKMPGPLNPIEPGREYHYDEDFKAGILFFIEKMGEWVNEKGELKSCDLIELIKLSFPDLITDKDLNCEDNNDSKS